MAEQQEQDEDMSLKKKEFKYRGKTLDELKEMDIREFAKLLKSNDFEKSVNELNEKQLTQVIKFASDKYYNKTPVISDEQFDYIKDTLNNFS